jgi:lysophospholipase L1-like esterase
VHQILVYADSLTWGIIPDTRRRLPFEQRWPGALELALTAEGRRVRVIENCLNGRRTVWDDPFKPGRNGLSGLAQIIEANSPLSLVILMLGTNDFQSMHPHNAWHSAQGTATLINAIRQAPIEPGMPLPKLLIVAPPPIENPRGKLASKFAGADTKCAGLADALRIVAEELSCSFYDAGTKVRASRIDGIHLDAQDHAILGQAIATVVGPLLED